MLLLDRNECNKTSDLLDHVLCQLRVQQYFPFLSDGTHCPTPFPFPFYHCPPTTSTMSHSSREVTSHFNYQAIFDSALEAYKKKTGKDLTADPLLCCFETCDSPDAILAILREQALGPGQFQSSGDEFLTWLNPVINVLNAFSAAIGGSVGQVSRKEIRLDIQPDLRF